MWKKIVKGEGVTGIYLVAYYGTLDKEVSVRVGSCIDGEWRIGPFDIPIAWMPIPPAPSLADLGICDPVDDEEEQRLRAERC